MCDPATAALVLSIAGGATSAYQSAAIGNANATLAQFEADQAAEIGRFNEARARSRMDRLIARQRGELVARGVRLDSVSAGRLGAEAAGERFVEGQAQRFNTSSRVTALSNEGRILQAEGRLGAAQGLFNTGARSLTSALDLWPELAGT